MKNITSKINLAIVSISVASTIIYLFNSKFGYLSDDSIGLSIRNIDPNIAIALLTRPSFKVWNTYIPYKYLISIWKEGAKWRISLRSMMGEEADEARSSSGPSVPYRGKLSPKTLNQPVNMWLSS